MAHYKKMAIHTITGANLLKLLADPRNTRNYVGHLVASWPIFVASDWKPRR